MQRSILLALVCLAGIPASVYAQGFARGASGSQRPPSGPIKFPPGTPRSNPGPNTSGQFNNGGFNNNNNPFGGGGGNNSGFNFGALINAASRPQNNGFQPQNNNFQQQNRPLFAQPQFQQQQSRQFQQDDFSQQQFAQPQFRSAPTTASFAPQVAATPVPAAPAFSNLPIVLRCSSAAVGQCNYQLTERTGVAYPYTIAPGKKQVFNETTQWELSFDRGDGQRLRYQLSGGEIYEIRQEGGMWICYCAS